MKFVQKDLGEAADASAAKGGAAKELVKLSLLVLAIAIAIYVVVGFAVDALVPRISVETEKKIFGGISARVGKPEKPGRKLQRLEAVLEKLVASSEAPPLDYRLFIVKDKRPNAVALPGGAIGVTTGLLREIDDEVAIAFVLGHELGHFRNRDHLRGLGRAVGISVCYALLFGGGGAGELLAGNAMNLMERKYSRRQEEAADRTGLKLVHRAYGKVEGVTRFFEIMLEKERCPGWAYMFSTHPATEKRIRALKKYGAELAPGSRGGR